VPKIHRLANEVIEELLVGSEALHFDVAPRNRKMLLEGLDEIGLTQALEPRIAAFQAADRKRRPWIYPP